ncbi:uncharacterized protein I303_106444 [Kwoniella dejecticola CBS 10117]|uniref:Protein CPL1-like domain-containing protein n=1 Tax=Kwoniella dejecticola CBS 10117 TaxID=1296121 RepID=A0A1A5ZUP4_9TREE|nr:uncharacterized protein I303_08297 [Kwoniella dejecticola CBS 10117]OBR81527.1 hypothetical protein I303_08297 [Kwoniella dejecticola CBS 10117]
MVPSMFASFSAFAIMASFALKANAASYLGCVTTKGNTPVVNTLASVASCDTYCGEKGGNTEFLYFRASDNQCSCGTTASQAQYWAQGSASTGACTNSENYLLYSRTTTFNFQGCYTNMATDKAPEDVNSFEECLAACATEGSAMVEPLGETNKFGCRCNNAYTIEGGTPATTCDAYTWFNYIHSQEATASGLARRQNRERLQRLRREKQTLCPRGAKACAVPGTAAYECIDTRSELEACGGCLFGEYQNPLNSTVGIDCTSLAGIAQGAVTCANSQCEAFACKSGFQLASGLCVPLA